MDNQRASNHFIFRHLRPVKAYRGTPRNALNTLSYDTGISVEADDYILTLITCDRSYGGASGRLIVMAVME